MNKFLLSICLTLLSFSSFAAADTDPIMDADKHLMKGLKCQTCHGPDLSKPRYPDQKICTQCHAKNALASKTEGQLPGNPHAAPHNAECTLCHLQHEKPVDYCATCHKFSQFNTP